MEGDAQAGLVEHGKVVGAVPDGDGLGDIHLFRLGNQAQEVCLAAAVHHVAHVTAGEFAVLAYFQFVGIDIVNAIFALEILPEERESAAEDGNLVAAGFEDAHQAVRAFRDGQMLCDVPHHAHVQAFKQCHAFCKAFLEVNLSAHGAFRNGSHLVVHAVTAGQFVDALRLDERRVHIEADEAAHAAVHIVLLEGEVHAGLRAHGHQVLLEGLPLLIRKEAAERKLHAGAHVLFRMLDTHAARKALNGVDIEAIAADHLRGGMDLRGAEAPADDGEDVAVAALAAGPGLIIVVRNGRKANADAAQLRGLEKEFLHHLAGMGFIDTDEDAHGKGIVDDGLAKVQDLGVVLGQNGHNGCGESDSVLAGNAD